MYKRLTESQIAAWRGYPQKIRVDNGSEFVSSEFAAWAEKHNSLIAYI